MIEEPAELENLRCLETICLLKCYGFSLLRGAVSYDLYVFDT